MRRFFLQSLLLHGIALMLLFSWEIPQAGKITPRNIIQVSLIEKGEDETPPPKAEKAAEKPKAEKRIVKRDPAPPLDRTENEKNPEGDRKGRTPSKGRKSAKKNRRLEPNPIFRRTKANLSRILPRQGPPNHR